MSSALELCKHSLHLTWNTARPSLFWSTQLCVAVSHRVRWLNYGDMTRAALGSLSTILHRECLTSSRGWWMIKRKNAWNESAILTGFYSAHPPQHFLESGSDEHKARSKFCWIKPISRSTKRYKQYFRNLKSNQINSWFKKKKMSFLLFSYGNLTIYLRHKTHECDKCHVKCLFWD